MRIAHYMLMIDHVLKFQNIIRLFDNFFVKFKLSKNLVLSQYPYFEILSNNIKITARKYNDKTSEQFPPIQLGPSTL